MGVLLMLATILFTGAAIAAVVFLLIYGKSSLIKYVAGVCVVWFAAYALILLGVSLSSSEEVLEQGVPKRYCGFYLDCHMATTVTGVNRQKEYKGKTANGMFMIVGIEVSSDARRAELRLLSPKFQIIGGDKKKYEPITGLSTPAGVLEKRIGPDEGIDGEVVFDVPENLQDAKLDIWMADPVDVAIESIVIGDEDSFMHKRTYFSLGPKPNRAHL